MNDKLKRGGARKGAGAPKKETTKVITFCVKLWQESPPLWQPNGVKQSELYNSNIEQ
jgi:hypothetical protein